MSSTPPLESASGENAGINSPPAPSIARGMAADVVRHHRVILVQNIISARRHRTQVFGSNLFADPGWDLVLALYLAELLQIRSTISTITASAQVAPTTAMRWLDVLVRKGFAIREDDPLNARKVRIALSARGMATMEEWLARLSAPAHS